MSENYQIKQGSIANDNYVDEAEKIIRSLFDSKSLLSTSKIRNILSLVSELNDDLKREGDIEKDIPSRCNYIRMRFAYEAGRDKKVRFFVENADLLNFLKNINDKERCQLFCNYIEALVAYHKYVGGKS